MFGMDPKIERAKHVQNKYTDSLMQNQHVMGVSVRPVEGYVHKPEAYALVVLVDEHAEPNHIPSVLDDIPVIVQRVGRNTKQQ
jgi:hypothetical protein